MRKTTGALAGLVLAGGLLLAAGPAAAAPSCNGSSCDESESVTVAAQITETITPTSFTFNSGNPVPAGEQVGPLDQATGACTWFVGPFNGFTQNNYCPTHTVTVQTGDGSGYIVQQSGTDFTAPNGTSFPITALTEPFGVTPGAGFLQVENTAPTHTPQTIVTQHGASASGGDAYEVDDILQIPATAGNDTFSATVTYLAVAN